MSYWLDNSRAYWIPSRGVLEDVLITTYVGDNTNSREIDLGDNYHVVMIHLLGDFAATVHHHVEALAVGAFYSQTFEHPTSLMINAIGAGANAYFQGKMTGADANKIKLGTSGTSDGGPNVTGRTYQILAYKYSKVRP